MDIDTEIIFLEAQLPILHEWVRFSAQLAKGTKTAPICCWPRVLRYHPADNWSWLEIPDCGPDYEYDPDEEREGLIATHEAVIDRCRDMGWTAFWEAKERYDYYIQRLARLKQLKAAGEKIAPNRKKYKDWYQPISEKPITEE